MKEGQVRGKPDSLLQVHSWILIYRPQMIKKERLTHIRN